MIKTLSSSGTAEGQGEDLTKLLLKQILARLETLETASNPLMLPVQ